jgi:TDG/mug DNA glycosylase family protein
MDAMELETFDILLPGLPVVFCGINPSVRAAETGHNFGSASNRFWRALHLAGFTPSLLRAQDDRSILRYGFGSTAAATRPTRRASELTNSELRGAIALFRRKMEHFQPMTIAFLGRPAFAAITGTSEFGWGPQPAPFAGAQAWVLPNPSGLNRAFTLDRLVQAYAALRVSSSVALKAWVAGIKISRDRGGAPRDTLIRSVVDHCKRQLAEDHITRPHKFATDIEDEQ